MPQLTRAPQKTLASWLVLYPLCLVASGVALLNFASGIVRPVDAATALHLNPLDAAARLDVLVEQLTSSTSNPTEEVEETVATGIRLAPIDARFYSLMGIVQERTGHRERAERHFAKALMLLPTEIQALQHRLAFTVEDRNFEEAVDEIELIGRRWPKHWSLVEPLLPAVLSDKAAYEDVLSRFSAESTLRSLLIGSLTEKPETLSLAYRVALDWHRRGASEIEGIIDHVTWALLRASREAEAFLLFQLTYGSGGSATFVYNGAFELPLSGNPFDWTLRKQAGVNIERVVGIAPLDSTRPLGGDSKALRIRFLDNPIQFRNVSQLVRLPPGEYDLTVRYSSHNLVQPKPLQFAVGCRGQSTDLAAIAFDDGSTRILRASFSVPIQGCALQNLYVYNDPMPLSWKNRYSGTLYLQQVAITRSGS